MHVAPPIGTSKLTQLEQYSVFIHNHRIPTRYMHPIPHWSAWIAW